MKSAFGLIDYHQIVTINTPISTRRSNGVGDYWINASLCLICKVEVRSKGRNDYRTCECGNLSVWGGSWFKSRKVKNIDNIQDKSQLFKDLRH